MFPTLADLEVRGRRHRSLLEHPAAPIKERKPEITLIVRETEDQIVCQAKFSKCRPLIPRGQENLGTTLPVSSAESASLVRYPDIVDEHQQLIFRANPRKVKNLSGRHKKGDEATTTTGLLGKRVVKQKKQDRTTKALPPQRQVSLSVFRFRVDRHDHGTRICVPQAVGHTPLSQDTIDEREDYNGSSDHEVDTTQDHNTTPSQFVYHAPTGPMLLSGKRVLPVNNSERDPHQNYGYQNEDDRWVKIFGCGYANLDRKGRPTSGRMDNALAQPWPVER
ncbi:hypothetical protein BKA93DRAFT_746462 [Sparassis latifolia]